jgi:hypothetical protein
LNFQLFESALEEFKKEKYPDEKEVMKGKEPPKWGKTGKLVIVNAFFFLMVCLGIFLASGSFNLLGYFKGSIKKDDGL